MGEHLFLESKNPYDETFYKKFPSLEWQFSEDFSRILSCNDFIDYFY